MANTDQSTPSPGSFEHVDTWVFDLDNTLYPAHSNLFAQVDQRMGSFISELLSVDFTEARRLQKKYFAEHGTTLRGLMAHHGIAPEDFLDYVHDIDVSVLDVNAALSRALDALAGRKLVFTNGSHGHAANVLGRLEIEHHFDFVFDISDADYLPKPEHDAYTMFVERSGIDATRTAMFEDIARNLEAPHALGMTTVLVRSPNNASADFVDAAHGITETPHYVHHETHDLADFLADLTGRAAARSAAGEPIS